MQVELDGRRASEQLRQQPGAVEGHRGLSLQQELLHRRVVDRTGAFEQDARRPQVGDRLECLDPLGTVVPDLASDRALGELDGVAGALGDHRQHPGDEHLVEEDVAGAVDERRDTERRQRLDHRLEVGDRPGGARDRHGRAAPCCSTSPSCGCPWSRQRKGPGRWPRRDQRGGIAQGRARARPPSAGRLRGPPAGRHAPSREPADR